MKTAKINSKRSELSYRTNSGMYTKAVYNNRVYKNGLSCDVYDADDNEHKILILTSGGRDVQKSLTILTNSEYEEISDLYDPYAGGRYHTALLKACGAENLFQLA